MKKLTILMITLFTVSIVWAQGMGTSKGMGPGKMGQGMAMQERLNLTDEQKSQLQNLRLTHQKEVIPYHSDLKIKMIELREMIAKGESEKNLLKKNNEINEIKTKLSDLRLKHQLKVRAIVGEENFKLMGMGRGLHGGGMKDGCMGDPKHHGKPGKGYGHGWNH
jgi:Spy/CpxP family protein refolding chaperone